MSYERSFDLIVSDTWKVELTLQLDTKDDEVVDWWVKDAAGANISEDVSRLYYKTKYGIMKPLSEILMDRAIEEMKDD